MRAFAPFRFLLMAALLGGAAVSSRAANDTDYAPLDEGSEWVMDAAITMPDGQILRGTGRRQTLSSVPINGAEYVQVRTSVESPLGELGYTKLMRRDASGVYSIDVRDPNGTVQTELPLPLKVGATWTAGVGENLAHYTIVGVEDITIGSRTYKECYHIHAERVDGSLTEDSWEAPVLGCVKSTSSFTGGGGMTLTLHDYKPGKGVAPSSGTDVVIGEPDNRKLYAPLINSLLLPSQLNPAVRRAGVKSWW